MLLMCVFCVWLCVHPSLALPSRRGVTECDAAGKWALEVEYWLAGTLTAVHTGLEPDLHLHTGAKLDLFLHTKSYTQGL